MKSLRHFVCLAFALLVVSGGGAVSVSAQPVYGYQVVNQYPHDTAAFTQGLVLQGGRLFESTGLYGSSSLREVNLQTGVVIRSVNVPSQYFAEGMTIFQGKVFQVTWQSQTGFIYNPDTFALIGQFSYSGEGWGLTHDAQNLILSDGTNQIRFLDPVNFQTVRSIAVFDSQSRPVTNINELEYVNGEIYANIWQTNLIARINPQTGAILGWIDLAGLLPPGTSADVLNGIAFDSATGHLLVTGKLWPYLFEIVLQGAANVPPVVTLTSPGNGATLTAPATVALAATASDPDGPVRDVTFYANGTLVGTDTTSPYSGNWTGVAAGTYTITAVATDMAGAATPSAAAQITVTTGTPPPGGGRVNVALAANGGTATASSSYGPEYPVSATINGDRRGTGWAAGGAWMDATANAFPDWVDVTFNGSKTIDEVAVVSLQDAWANPGEPTASLTFTAYGLADFTVQYWTGSAWQAVPGGVIRNNTRVWRSLTFAAVTTTRIRVLTERGLNTFSRVVEIEAYAGSGSGGGGGGGGTNLPPVVTLTSPGNGATLTAPATVALAATASDPDGPVRDVTFYANGTLVGTDTTSPYSGNWTGVAAGTYTITAVATDMAGAATPSAAAQITVTTGTPPPGGGRVNVALAANGGTATASSSYGPEYPVSATINGDRRGAGWAAGGAWMDATANAFPDWVDVTFNGSKTIDEVAVVSLQDAWANPGEPTASLTFTAYGLADFTVQYWTGSAWQAVPGGVIRNNTLVWRSLTFAAVTTTRIRVLTERGLNAFSRVVEIEAYAGSGSGGGTAPPAGVEWFVASGGNGNGSSAAPYGRIQDALAVARPGETITVRPGTYAETLGTVRSGVAGSPITLRAAGARGSVVVTAPGRVLTVSHSYVSVDGLVLDGQYGLDDLVRIANSGHFFELRHSELRRSTKDLIDMGNVQGVSIIGCLLHHALNAANGHTDAHGIAAAAVTDLLIRDSEIHTFSGDGLQVDPVRSAPGWNRVTVERTRFWIAPLPAAENGFPAGATTGENAIDTKASSSFARATIVLRDIVASGFRGVAADNVAAFNLKENVDATVDRVTVYDSDIAFRLRGPAIDGASVAVKNAVIFNTTTAFRYEDDVQNLRVWNVTIGSNVTRAFVAASSVSTGLDVRNLLILGSLPPEASHASNLSVTAQAFVNAAQHDYQLSAGSPAIDVGVAIGAVATDRGGFARPQGAAYDVGAFERH